MAELWTEVSKATPRRRKWDSEDPSRPVNALDSRHFSECEACQQPQALQGS